MTIKTKVNFWPLYSASALLALADAVAGYTQSSFLGQFFSLSSVGLIIGAGAALSLMLTGSITRLIARLSPYYAGLSLVILNIIASLVLATTHSPLIALLFFIIRYLGFMFLLVVLDIFVEDISSDKQTGVIRSEYLTAINVAWLASPLLMSFLVGANNNYAQVYWFGSASLGCLFLFFLLRRRKLLSSQAKPTPHLSFISTLKQLLASADLTNIFLSVVLLNIFYALAVLYLPIFLHDTLALSWGTIGVIFTIMLLPFVLLQIPAGYLADKLWGEKEMLMAGHLLIALTSLAIFTSVSREPIFWAALLFLSRVGAALAESMQEIYFYKKIDARQIGLINFFRQARSLGWLLGALIAFLFLRLTGIRELFLIVSLIFFASLWPLKYIKDTK